jgi:hypothetical protein
MPGNSKTTKSDQKHPKTTFQRRKDQGLWECASRSQGISKKQWLTKNTRSSVGKIQHFQSKKVPEVLNYPGGAGGDKPATTYGS